MSNEKKRYSLITVDRGLEEAEEGVRTTRSVIDGEETIVVSSESSASQLRTGRDPLHEESKRSPIDQLASRSQTGDNMRSGADPNAYSSLTSTDHERSDQSQRAKREEEEDVPFRRMQAIIIVSLIELIVVFLVYFNFLR